MMHKVLKWDSPTIRRAIAVAVVPYPESFPTDQLATKICQLESFRSSWDKRGSAWETYASVTVEHIQA